MTGYSASYLPRRDGYRGHLSVPHGADPAKPWWSCPHPHRTAEAAVRCAEAEAAERLAGPVTLAACMHELAQHWGLDMGGAGDQLPPS